MKDFKAAVVDEFLQNITFANIGQYLNNMTTEEKDAFAKLCISGDAQLSGYLKGICYSIAKDKAQVKVDQIMADGTITVVELKRIIQFLK